jgi:AcrR family transcriptional regulator
MAKKLKLQQEPLRRRLRQQTDEAYRRAIVEAAESVFLAQGFAEARMADVAKAAGVSVGTLYNYFESKELVFASLIQIRQSEFSELMRSALSEPTREPMPLHLMRALFEYLQQKSGLVALFTQLGAVTENDLRRVGGPAMEAHYREYLQILERAVQTEVSRGALRKDVPARLLATTLAGPMNALVFEWMQEGRPPKLGERGDALYALFVQGAKQ